MSTTEVFQHYKLVKKNFVFPSVSSLNSVGSTSKEQSFDEDLTEDGAGEGLYDCPSSRVALLPHQQQQHSNGEEVDEDDDNYMDMEKEGISPPQSNNNSFRRSFFSILILILILSLMVIN